MTLANATIDGNAEADKLLSRGLLELFRSLWLDDTGVGWNDPRVNLLDADLSGLPPTAIYYGAHELLAGEAVELAQRARAAGNDVALQSVPAGQHSFIVGAGRVPEVDDAVAEMGDWLRSKLGLGELSAVNA
jgi:epsilon-lactone hydrolase